MSYVKITLAIGKCVDEDEWNNNIYPKLKSLSKIKPEDEDFEYELKYELRPIVWNYGYYHSEYSIGFELDIRDSDIRTGQNFNYELPTIDQERIDKVIDKKILDLFKWKKEDLSLQIMVRNY